MEHHSPAANASAWLNRNPAGTQEGEEEIVRLKERLSFYESFDQLIQDNVSRASELLRHAATMRENAEQELTQARRQMEALRDGDRRGYRSLLAGLLDDVTTMQVQIERLARRVSDALDDLEQELPVGARPGLLSATAGTVEAPEESAPPLPIEPTMDELLPPEPEGEATYGIPQSEPPQEVEAEVVAAEIETVEAAGVVPEGEPGPGVSEEPSASGETETGAAAPAGTETGDTLATAEAILDSIVQEPVDERSLTAGQAAQHEAEEIGDGVLSEESREVSEAAAAPAAPAEENTVETASTTEAAGEPGSPGTAERAPSRLPWISADVRPFSIEGIGGLGIRRPGTGELRAPQPPPRPAARSSLLAGEGVGTAVLVHGVPRATTALSLKRFLESLEHVASVEPREYAEGVLRLQVTAERPLSIDDLRGWEDGASLEPVHLRDDLIEVRLPT